MTYWPLDENLLLASFAEGSFASAGKGLATTNCFRLNSFGYNVKLRKIMQTLYINGKFLAQRMTGVQRFAIEMLRAIDDQLATVPGAESPVLLVPLGTEAIDLKVIRTRQLGGSVNLHFWEQATLWRGSREGLLLSFAGTSPLFHPQQIVTLHDAAVFDHPDAYTRSFQLWYRFAFKVLKRKALLILVPSEFSRQRLTARIGGSDRYLVTGEGAEHVTRLRADVAVLDRLQLNGSRYLLAVGSANPTKNFARLVEAFDAVTGVNDVRLVVVGGGNHAVFARTKAVTSSPRIVAAGSVSDEELKALYENATAFVFPSTYEGFGLPPLEAMACGCPVVAADAASIPEVCGEAALYFDPYDPRSIADAIRRIIADDALRARLRTAAAERIRLFTWRRAAETLRANLPEARTRA